MNNLQETPRVSIILPTYNGSRFLRQALDSIINQNETDFELIIVNDCSTDNTLDIVRAYADKDIRIRVVTNEVNLRLPASLNVGFKLARAKYLTWTSDDNIYDPKAIKFMADYLDAHPQTDMVNCAHEVIDENGVVLDTCHVAAPPRKAADLIGYCNIGAAFMYTRAIQRTVGEYDVTRFCVEDYDYWLRIGLAGQIDYVDNVLYKYRMNPTSLTATKGGIVRKLTQQLHKQYLGDYIKKYNITGRHLAYICYRMWLIDFDNKDLIRTIFKNSLYYALKVIHWHVHPKKRAYMKKERSVREVE